MPTYNVISFTKEEEYVSSFLSLPKELSKNCFCTQDYATEQQLLFGTHPLSENFAFYPFLVFDDQAVVARAALTAYPNESIIYLGFFECIDDLVCAKQLFTAVEEFANSLGYTTIQGPVDASFWLKYRMKENYFNDIYAFEPYNLAYYPKLWQENGYNIKQNYVSTMHNATKITRKFFAQKESQTLKYRGKDYRVLIPTKSDWDESIDVIYELISALYADFPAYQPITKEQFMPIFADLKFIVDLKLVRIIYYEDQPVGFFVVLPDYRNLLNEPKTLINIIKILHQRRFCNRYVMLYLGVHPDHKGLARNLIHAASQIIRQRTGKAIGALRKTKAVTEDSDARKYALYEKNLETER